MGVRDVHSASALEEAVRLAPRAAVHFWAAWCEPCRHMDAVFAELAAESPQHSFLRVEAEEVPEVSEKYGVTAVPFFLLFQDGAVVDTLEGANAPELAHKVSRHLATHPSRTDQPAPATSGASATPMILEEKLRNTGAETTGKHAVTPGVRKRVESLIHREPVMLFMKGSPAEPRCGFSRKVVAALQREGVKFGTFDILSDEEIRAGVKELSDWPTFPQLYVKGELVGGCDIILEMQQSGELSKQLAEQGVLPGGEAIKSKVKRLVDAHKTMLFMKGTPDEPRCGFSRKVVQLLRDEGADFGSFDILSDHEIRQGLKDFSDWPTFPQLYHRGEFVGGCDIISEMHQNGELKAVLAG